MKQIESIWNEFFIHTFDKNEIENDVREILEIAFVGGYLCCFNKFVYHLRKMEKTQRYEEIAELNEELGEYLERFEKRANG